MDIKLFNGEADELIELLITNQWSYHSNPHVAENEIKEKVEKGYYSNGRETFWIIVDEQKLGILIIDDIEDTIPLFDLRLTPNARGKGIGVQTLQWLQNYLFGERGKIRIEGYTRADNLAMRKCFTNAGFVKEGYLRNAWENADGTIHDTVLYASIFGDWKEHKITGISINDLPY